LIAFYSNPILVGYLSRKALHVAPNLITLLGVDNKVIRFDPIGYILSTEVILFKIRFLCLPFGEVGGASL
jgi:hypothetical protein